MIYRHKVGLVKSFNKKLASTLATLLILASPIMSAASLLIPPVANAAPITDHVVINEVFPSPSSGSEWIELHNPTSADVDLTGWTIKDAANPVQPISGIIVAGGFATFDVDYFNNSGDTAYLNNGSSEVDSTTYPSVAFDSSRARVYDGSPDFETRSGTAVTKNSTNGSAPLVAPTITNIDAYYVKSNYRGIGVDIHVNNLTDATGVEVKVDRSNGGPVTKTSKSTGIVLPTLNTGNPASVTAPIVIQQGSYNEAGSSSWNQPSTLWNSGTVPTSITVTISRGSESPLVQSIYISEVSTPFATLSEVMPTLPAAASQTTQIVHQDEFANTMNTWTYHNDNTLVADPLATSNHEIAANPTPAAGNNGAVKLTAQTGDRWNLASLQYSGTKLTDIAALGFDVRTDSPNRTYINLDVDFNHSGLSGWQGRLVYEPTGLTANTWVSQEAVASNGQWKWSNMITGAASVWPDGDSSASRSWSEITQAFPDARITALDNAAFGSLYLRTDGVSTTYFDNVYLATNSANVKYNFEIPEVFVNNPSDSSFNYSEMYVRAGNGSDESGIVRVPGQADSVRFNYDGSTDFTDVAGYEHLQAGQWPNANGDKQFRVKTSLPAGKYHVTAEFRVDGNWYPVTGDETAYSIDIPTATYTTPSATTHLFRVSDNPVKLRVEDQFKQFKYMVVEVNGNKFAVTREQCDLREEGNILFCDVKSAIAQSIAGVDYPAWIPLSEGTYTAKTSVITKANNRVDNLISPPFTIDNTYPTLTNFKVINPSTVYSKNIPVSAEATDANGIEYVKFFITAPKLSDGTCDGNGVGDGIQYGVHSSGNTYLATFDTSNLNGYYCLNALSKDSATHTSNPILRMKVKIDNTAPIWDISPVHNSPLNNSNQPVGSNILMQWSDATDESGVKYFYEVSSVSPVTTGEDNHFVSPFYTPFGPLSVSQMDATGTAPGTYYWHVKACDDLDNCTPWTNPWTGTVDEASNTITTPPTINQPNAGSSNPPVITLASFGANAITQLGNAQNFGFQPAQVSDGVVAAVPNTPQVLGASDNKDGSGDVLGDNASDFSKDGFNIMGIAWYYFLAALAAIGGLWWILAAKRRKQNDA